MMTELETNNESVEYADDEREEERDEELESAVSAEEVHSPADVEVHHDEPVADPEEPRTMEAVGEVETLEAEVETAEAEVEEPATQEPEAEEAEEAETAEDGKERGTVKWFSPSKGYGFISRENGEDVFVHFSAIEGGVIGGFRTLREGDRVKFEVEQTPKGPRAEHVELA